MSKNSRRPVKPFDSSPDDEPLGVSAFPWELRPTEYMDAFHDAGPLDPREELTSPFGARAVLELGAVVDILLGDYEEPLANALLSFPDSRVAGSTDNHHLKTISNYNSDSFDGESLTPQPFLVIDCHVKKTGKRQWRFRPEGLSEYFYSSPLGYDVPNELEEGPQRLISLVEVDVVDGEEGPEVEFVHIQSFNADDFYSTKFPSFPGIGLAASLRLQNALRTLLLSFKFSDVELDEYESMQGAYFALLGNEFVEDIHPERESNLKAQWIDFVSSFYPKATLPARLAGGSPARESASVMLPAPRLVKTPRDGENYAAEVMASIGFTQVAVSPVGPDGGIDVESTEAVAQVKMEGRSSTREQLQRLTGISLTRNTGALFFSLAGFTASALDWGEATDIALFEFSYDGSLAPKSSLAEKVLQHGVWAFNKKDT